MPVFVDAFEVDEQGPYWLVDDDAVCTMCADDVEEESHTWSFVTFAQFFI